MFVDNSWKKRILPVEMDRSMMHDIKHTTNIAHRAKNTANLLAVRFIITDPLCIDQFAFSRLSLPHNTRVIRY